MTTQDATIEKLGEFLADRSFGMGVVVDELASFIKGLDRKGHEGARPFYLKSWNGYLPDTVDRIGRGTIHIDASYVVVLGGMQPDIFQKIVREAAHSGDGLVQRFQLAIAPTVSRPFKIEDWKPNSEAFSNVSKIFEKIANIVPDDFRSSFFENEENPFFKFDESAQRLFNEFHQDLEYKIGAKKNTPVFESHISKYRSTMPALAMIFHLISLASKGYLGDGSPFFADEFPVGIESARASAMWIDLLMRHAKTLYGVEEADPAFALSERILSGEVKNGEHVRTISRKEWKHLSTTDQVNQAIKALEAAQWIRLEKREDTGGRPAFTILINPRLTSLRNLKNGKI